MLDPIRDTARSQRGATQVAVIATLAGLGLFGAAFLEPTLELVCSSAELVWDLLRQLLSPETWVPTELLEGG